MTQLSMISPTFTAFQSPGMSLSASGGLTKHDLAVGAQNGSPSSASVASISLDGSFDGLPEGLTAEGLLLFLQTRMNGLDEQINGIFKKMQDMEKVRKLLNQMQNELNQLDDDNTKKDLQGTQHTAGEAQEYEKNILDCIDAIAQIDPKLAESLRSQLGVKGQILDGIDGLYFTSEVNNSRELLNSVAKQLESAAQLDMIRLQSLTATRGTAFQMISNTLGAFNETSKTLAGAIR